MNNKIIKLLKQCKNKLENMTQEDFDKRIKQIERGELK